MILLTIGLLILWVVGGVLATRIAQVTSLVKYPILDCSKDLFIPFIMSWGWVGLTLAHGDYKGLSHKNLPPFSIRGIGIKRVLQSLLGIIISVLAATVVTFFLLFGSVVIMQWLKG